MKNKEIILIGGGGHCKSCIDVFEQLGGYSIVGILDKIEKIGDEILGIPVIGTDDDIISLSARIKFFMITIGQIESPTQRISLYNLLVSQKVQLPVVISPHAYVSTHSRIGQGTIVMHGAIVNAEARIGENCIINSKGLIEHDAIIGNHCHISTGAIVNGGVEVGDGTFIGSGAIIVHGAKIPPNSFIKANSLFIK